MGILAIYCWRETIPLQITIAFAQNLFLEHLDNNDAVGKKKCMMCFVFFVVLRECHIHDTL